MYSDQVFLLPPQLASVEISASEQQNSPTSQSNYKSHSNYYTTTQSFYDVLVEHTDFVQE